jgi:putative redox protein
VKTTSVTFENRVGYQLSGLLDVPDGGVPRAYGLFAHCFTCGKDLKPFANMNAAMTEQGLGMLRFDFSGLGRSEGDFSESNLSSNETDLIDAAAFLSREHAPPKLLIGHSLGGVAMLRAARHIAEARAVVTIASPADPSHLGKKLSRARDEASEVGESQVAIGGRHFTLKKQFFDDLEETGISEELSNLNKALLIMHSPNDTMVDIANAALLFQGARHPKSFVSLGDADHLLLEEKDARYAGAVIAAWVENYL